MGSGVFSCLTRILSVRLILVGSCFTKTSIAKLKITELILLTILVDPARGHCYRCSSKPCESYVLCEHGVLLSNTWITCPWVRHNPGKLGIIPDNAYMLEFFMRETDSSAQGWVCGLSGSSGCNVPTSRRRVRVVRARARRWILRHESRPYGAQ